MSPVLSSRLDEVPTHEPQDQHPHSGRDSAAEPHDGPLPQPRAVTSEDLLQGKKEVLIVHRGEVYRLRQTRNGKLILSK